MTIQYPVLERAGQLLGVPGRFYTVHAPQDVRGRLVHRNQKWFSESRPIKGWGFGGAIQVEVSFDDQCSNGHQTFHITADISSNLSRQRNDVEACGMLHDEIRKVFPELEPLIKWHSMTTDGPLHYIANTTYQASDLDNYGRAEGEPSYFETVVKFGDSPYPVKLQKSFAKWAQEALDSGRKEFGVIAIPHTGTGTDCRFSPQFTLEGWDCTWATAPFRKEYEAQGFAAGLELGAGRVRFEEVPIEFSKGKTRDLEAARRAAVWPEATDEQLMLPKEELAKLLEDRLPTLVAHFKKVMVDDCGFLWEPEHEQN